jgi:hypothetical protein
MAAAGGPDDGDGGGERTPAPFPDSLCHGCAARRYVRTKTSLFVMCTALDVKYPRQPVTACGAFRPAGRDAPSA